MRFLDEEDTGSLGSCCYKLLEACMFYHVGNPVWVVKLSVIKELRAVDGWAFLERDYSELRFERFPGMEPLGFLTGTYPAQGIEESSLAVLFDNPCDDDIARLEGNIRSFLNKCIFCVRALTDVRTGECRHEAASYRYGCAQFRSVIP